MNTQFPARSLAVSLAIAIALCGCYDHDVSSTAPDAHRAEDAGHDGSVARSGGLDAAVSEMDGGRTGMRGNLDAGSDARSDAGTRQDDAATRDTGVAMPDASYADDADAGLTDIDECLITNVCSSDYPCSNTVPDYYCRGQFAEWSMPDHEAGAQTAPSYEPSDSTVVDKITHLVWQKDPPATYAGCTGNNAMMGDTCTWAEAKAYCSSPELAASLGGTGWRLPTKIELESLVDRTRSNPAIDPALGQPSSAYTYWIFWTASADLHHAGNAYFVDFSHGASSSFPATTSYRARCVR